MITVKARSESPGWRESIASLALGVVCFNLAYVSPWTWAAAVLIFGYAFFLACLTDQPTVRRAFYFGLAAGFGCAAGQAFFFWNIFHAAAIVLWLVFAFWIGLFTAISCGCVRRWGKSTALWLVPMIWMGTEYFRSELYYLRFSWLNVGYAFSDFTGTAFNEIGMYGLGYLVFMVATAVCFRKFTGKAQMWAWGAGLLALLVWLCLLPRATQPKNDSSVKIAGIQFEFPPEHAVPEILDEALVKHPDAAIFVMSEYTLDGAVPDVLKNWCRKHSRYLIIGGKDVVTNEVYYDTVFVIGTNGESVFKQAKSVPIQFFKDGLPAARQDVWDSPWGKIGICICYDLSYTGVTDQLVRMGAQMVIAPSMDVEDWGRHEHNLHARVAPVRAAEYGIPVFRVASSGISQAVSSDGRVVAHATFPGIGDIVYAQIQLPERGTFPIDRLFAPFCVIGTATVTAILLFLEWREKRSVKNATAAKAEAKAVV